MFVFYFQGVYMSTPELSILVGDGGNDCIKALDAELSTLKEEVGF